jgi:hypothetical protein
MFRIHAQSKRCLIKVIKIISVNQASFYLKHELVFDDVILRTREEKQSIAFRILKANLTE